MSSQCAGHWEDRMFVRIEWACKIFGRWVQTQINRIYIVEESAFGGAFHVDELTIVGGYMGLYGMVLMSLSQRVIATEVSLVAEVGPGRD